MKIDGKKIVKEGYDKCAGKYLEDRDLYKNEKYLKDLTKKLKIGAKILDIGCGSGIPIDKYLIDKGFEVLGIDVSSEQIQLAKKNVAGGNFRQLDMEEIDITQESFDAVISFYAVFHIPRERHFKLFEKLCRLIKRGGYLLVTMGYDDWEGIENDFHGAKMFWSQYGTKKNIDVVKKAGFDLIYSKIDRSGGEKHQVIFAQK